jgi:sugar lactone lactonase YvrE
MSEDASPLPRADVALPFSSIQGPIGELIAQGMLSAPLRPGVLAVLDRFEILRELGRGGMGVVLLGRDPATGQEVAIKLVRADLAGDPRARQRFVKEAGHLKRLRHASVVPVLEISDRPRGPYFVMPYFEKGSLASRLKPEQPLGREDILEVALPVAEGLNFAHRRGIIHRDLKPANLLLGPGGGVCLADFGLARSLFNDTLLEVESRQWEGTAPYMSPAVAAGEAEDTRCDIYAFGALLYEMLTGHPPYQGQRTKEILDQIRAGPPKPITSLNPKADRGLAAIATDAMARELRDRYAEMQDILADLDRVRQGRPPIGPHGAGRKARPMLLRVGRVGRILWVPACLAGVAALGWMLWRTPGLTGHRAPDKGFDKGSDKGLASPAPGLTGQRAPATGPPLESRPEKPPADHAQGGVPIERPAPQPVLAFRTPWGIAADREGNVFVTDKDQAVVCKITPTGAMTNLAGLPGNPGKVDGPGAEARFILPRGIAVGQAGNVYLADANRLRAITPFGRTSPFPQRDGGPGGETLFDLPSGVVVDRQGNVFVAERYTIQKITVAGQITILAGKEGQAGREDGAGADARFSDMEKGIALDAAGNLYVGDMFNHTIRKITPAVSARQTNWVVTTMAGSPGIAGTADGPGSKARFLKPCGLAVDSSGNVYVADSGNHTIRKITPEGLVRTLAGMAGKAGWVDGPLTNALFDTPLGVALDGAGNVYVADAGNGLVRRLTPAEQVVSVGRRAEPLSGGRGAGASAPGVAVTLPETAKDCIRLARAGLGEEVILAFVRRDRNVPYTLTPGQVIYLEDQGVSANVIAALRK